MTHQNSTTSGPGTNKSEDANPHGLRSLANTPPNQQSVLVQMENPDTATKQGDHWDCRTDKLATDDGATKERNKRDGLTIELTSDRATKQVDQRHCQIDKLATPERATNLGDERDCLPQKKATADRPMTVGDELVSLEDKMATSDDAAKGGDKLVNLEEKFATAVNDSREGGKCDNSMDELSSTEKGTTEEGKRDTLADKLATAEKDAAERSKCDSLSDELSTVNKKTRGEEQRNSLMNNSASTDRIKKNGGEQKSLTDGLVRADIAAKTEGKLNGLPDKLTAVNLTPKGGGNSDNLSDKFEGMNLDDWNNFHRKKNKVYSFSIRRPNGKTGHIHWHHGPKEEVIEWGNMYSPFDDNMKYLLRLSALMSLHLNQTSEQSTCSINADAKYLSFACNCGRFHQLPLVSSSWGHNDLQPVQSDVCGNGCSPHRAPTLMDQMSPSFIAPSVGSHRQTSNAALSAWVNPYVQFELPFNHHMKSFWFHGTNSEQALDIITNGINLELGRYKRQFSNGFGFYLSDNFDHARWWACRKYARRPTVIVFKLSFSFNEYDGLNLAQNEQDWQDIVKFCLNNHSKNSFTVNNSLEQRYNSCDYVYGPVLKNWPKKSKVNTFIPIGFQGPCRQLCVRSINLAKTLGQMEHIDSVRTFTTQ